MTDNRVSNGKFGAILGGVVVALALAFFLFVGGVGKKEIATLIFRQSQGGTAS